jgi:hypothetical protein
LQHPIKGSIVSQFFRFLAYDVGLRGLWNSVKAERGFEKIAASKGNDETLGKIFRKKVAT